LTPQGVFAHWGCGAKPRAPFYGGDRFSYSTKYFRIFGAGMANKYIMKNREIKSTKDIAWELFKRTGEMRYYELYKSLVSQD